MRRPLTAVVVSLAAMACGHSAPTPAPQPTVSAPLPTTDRPSTTPPPPPPSLTATATLRDLAGTRVGTVTFTETYAGILVAGNIAGVGLGAHAIHVHEVGKCQPPFTSAGAHFNPLGKKHGYFSASGGHLGDLPNIDTPAAGRLRFELLLRDVTLRGANALLDADGAAIVVHGSRDNYYTDPSGDSGARIACGVIVLK